MMKTITFLGTGLFLANQLSAQDFSDNFNGNTVNTNLWHVVLPFAQSQMVESGGSLTTTGRATLETISSFNPSYLISGTVTLNDGAEHFGTTLRSDFSTETIPSISQYYDLTGIYVEFSMDGQQVSIQKMDNSTPNPPILAKTNFDFVVGQKYSFQIADTGSQISLAVNGTNLISAFTSFRTGNKIAFQSREFNYTSSSLSFIAVTETPLVSLLKSVRPTFSNLDIGTNYQLQISTDLINWTNNGQPFTATTNNVDYPQYFNIGNWDTLFFRLEVVH